MNINFLRGKYIWQKKKIFNIIRISSPWQKTIIQFFKKPNFIYKLDKKNIQNFQDGTRQLPVGGHGICLAPLADEKSRQLRELPRESADFTTPIWSRRIRRSLVKKEKAKAQLQQLNSLNYESFIIMKNGLSQSNFSPKIVELNNFKKRTFKHNFLFKIQEILNSYSPPGHEYIIKYQLTKNIIYPFITKFWHRVAMFADGDGLLGLASPFGARGASPKGEAKLFPPTLWEWVDRYGPSAKVMTPSGARGASPKGERQMRQIFIRLIIWKKKIKEPTFRGKICINNTSTGPSAKKVYKKGISRELKGQMGFSETSEGAPNSADLYLAEGPVGSKNDGVRQPKSFLEFDTRLLDKANSLFRPAPLYTFGEKRYKVFLPPSPFDPFKKSDPIGRRPSYQNIWFQNFEKSNQNTYFLQRPISFPFQWIQKGDLLSDCSSSLQGELALGQNLLVAYMPWEGFNFEDAVLINDKVLSKYTSLHIEKYDLEIAKSSLEKITYNIPGISPKNLQKLDKNGVIQIGSWVTPGDILVGRIIPMPTVATNLLTHEKLLHDIVVFSQKDRQIQERCLRVPQGVSGRIIRISYTHQQKDQISHKKKFFETILNFQSLFNFKKFTNLPKSVSLSPQKIYSQNRLNWLQKFLKERAEVGHQKNGLFLYLRNYNFRKCDPNDLFYTFINKNLKYPSPTIQLGLRPIQGFLGPKILSQIFPDFALTKRRVQPSLWARTASSKDGRADLGRPTRGYSGALILVMKKFWILPQNRANRMADFFQFFQNKNIYTKKLKNFMSISQRHFRTAEMEPLAFVGTLNPQGVDPFFFKQNQFRKQSQTKLLKTKVKTGPSAKRPEGQTQAAHAYVTSPIAFYSKNNYNFPQSTEVRWEKNTLWNDLPLTSSLLTFKKITIYMAEKREFQIGDKISGRHGNKGIISQIFSNSDMPYLSNGCTLDVLLNPLGVPSRMNVGQILECLLGFTGQIFHTQFRVLCFDEIYGYESSRSFIYSKLFELCKKTRQKWFFSKKTPGKFNLFDGRNGQLFYQSITVGSTYLMKLIHVVDEKIHARGTGPYSLITQQPLRGRAQHGGQRIGEMEVWALQGFGSAYTLQELLTAKSDDLHGRNQIMQTLLKNTPLRFGTPESLRVVLRELQCLCLDLQLSDQ